MSAHTRRGRRGHPCAVVRAGTPLPGSGGQRAAGHEARPHERLRRWGSGAALGAARPARDGLGAYYDARLILLRSEYEFLLVRGAGRAARLFEEIFGFTQEDSFETGPLNVTPDTSEILELRGRWELRIRSRKQHGMEPPALGPQEELAYRVFPREMTVPAELSMRRAYLGISRRLILERYGNDPGKKTGLMPGALRQRGGGD